MANWFKSLFSRRTDINNLNNYGTLQQADTINNVITAMINIPKKIVLGIALLLVILIAATLVWRSNISFDNQSSIINGNGNFIYNQSLDKSQNLTASFLIVILILSLIIFVIYFLFKNSPQPVSHIKNIKSGVYAEGNIRAENIAGRDINQNNVSHKTINNNYADTSNKQKEYEKQDNTIKPEPENELLFNINRIAEKLSALPKTEYSEEIALAYSSLGFICKTFTEFDKAIKFEKQGLEITKSEINRANIYANLGRIYQRKDDFNKSIECYHKSLTIAQKAGYKESMAVNYYSLGNMYKQTDKSQAAKYYQMSIDLYHSFGSQNEKLVQSWLDNLK